MLARFLYGPDGRIRLRRLIPLLVVCVALAIFGTLVVLATPSLPDNAALRTIWVLFAVLALKMPLIVLLWWFVVRNREWPGRPVRWSPQETQEILAYLEAESGKAAGRPDAPARLAYLSREAWHVADQVEGTAKVDALTVALRIDQVAARVRERRTNG